MTREENIETTRTFVRLLEQRRLEEFSKKKTRDWSKNLKAIKRKDLRVSVLK